MRFGRRREHCSRQRIVGAAKRGRGIRLTADEAFTLGVLDDAIVTRAMQDACDKCNAQGWSGTCMHDPNEDQER